MDKKQASEFFDSIDWTLFYQEKMALQETIKLLSDSETPEAANAIEWLHGILNMMDAMGDTAEAIGLFEYPERDENDRCFDERFNDVLKKTPENNSV